MSVISLRLPDDLEAKLEQEASRTSRAKSEIARDAIVDYLARQERERFLASLEAAARSLAADPQSTSEALSVASEFLPLENEALALGEPPSRYRAAPATKSPRKAKR